jgi:hypothetical protein
MFSSKKSKITPTVMRVKEHNPWLCPLLFISAILGVIILYFTLIDGKGSFIEQEQQADMQSILQQNASFAKQNAELRSQLAMMVRSTQESQNTYTQVLQSLTDLTEEITFYKSILLSSSTQKSANLVLSKLSFSYDKHNKEYNYELILTRQIATTNIGTMEINIEGDMNGDRTSLNMQQLTNNTIEHIKYNFMFFKKISSFLQLPEEFTPHYLIVRLTPQEQQANEIRFKWAELQLKEQQ